MRAGTGPGAAPLATVPTTLSDPAAAHSGVTLSQPSNDRAPSALHDTMTPLADGRLRLRAHKSTPRRQAAEARPQMEGGNVRERIILTLN
jgi:hypothetical protein